MSALRMLVRIGDLRVATDDATLVTVGIGSCIAVAVLDPVGRVGGLGHALLPEPFRNGKPAPPGRFATTAIERLLEMMREEGGDPKRAVAWLVGGARMFEGLAPSGVSIGDRNVTAARATLEAAGVPIRGEIVGGGRGRSVYFDVGAGRLRITSVQSDDVFLHE
ncbi:MAG: chemotaxis protein CheD [Longimicrobiales bacterium]